MSFTKKPWIISLPIKEERNESPSATVRHKIISFLPCAGYFYFFNPFSVEIFRQVIGRILDSWEENPRPLTLVLYYPEDDAIFYLEQHTLFRLVDEIAASDAVCHDRRERFCLYRLE